MQHSWKGVTPRALYCIQQHLEVAWVASNIMVTSKRKFVTSQKHCTDASRVRPASGRGVAFTLTKGESTQRQLRCYIFPLIGCSIHTRWRSLYYSSLLTRIVHLFYLGSDSPTWCPCSPLLWQQKSTEPMLRGGGLHYYHWIKVYLACIFWTV